MRPVPQMSVEEFRQHLQQLGRRRALFVYDAQAARLIPSEPTLLPLAEALQNNRRDFNRHEAIFLEVGQQSGALLGAFLHRTRRGQGQGGVRHWPYESVYDLCVDGLRLARGMGRKNALAGLWWGGGKGIIAQPDERAISDAAFRRELYRDYGRFITSLCGAYVTAEDVGTNASDMAAIYSTTRFVTCVPAEVGGSGNPSPSTAKGVVCAMDAGLEFLGEGNLEGKRVAMQGTGNVGSEMIQLLLDRGVASIVAAEIRELGVARLKARFSDPRLDVRLVPTHDSSIFEEACDVFAPNALGGILNGETIAKLRCKLVCGAANNQLLDEKRDAERLVERGITHVPDFVANRMGIVNCANEQYGWLPHDPAIERHFDRTWDQSVHAVTRRVLELSQSLNTTPTLAANQLADELAEQPHPIWGHRTGQIVTHLVRTGWAREA